MSVDSIYGTLNLLILRTLDRGSAHGLAIKDSIAAATQGGLDVEVGALYPALHRLQRDGHLSAEWGHSDKGRRAKIYSLTEKGRRKLESEIERWRRHVNSVEAVVGS